MVDCGFVLRKPRGSYAKRPGLTSISSVDLGLDLIWAVRLGSNGSWALAIRAAELSRPAAKSAAAGLPDLDEIGRPGLVSSASRTGRTSAAWQTHQ